MCKNTVLFAYCIQHNFWFCTQKSEFYQHTGWLYFWTDNSYLVNSGGRDVCVRDISNQQTVKNTKLNTSTMKEKPTPKKVTFFLQSRLSPPPPQILIMLLSNDSKHVYTSTNVPTLNVNTKANQRLYTCTREVWMHINSPHLIFKLHPD